MIKVAVLLMAGLAIMAWQILRQPGADPVYQGKKLSAWVDDALFGGQSAWFKANSVLLNLRPGDNEASFKAMLDEVVPCVIRRLQTKDNRLWKLYTVVKQKTPRPISGWMPQWREPREVRFAAASWLAYLGSGIPETAVPALCNVARKDPDQMVRRAAIDALSNIGVYSQETVPIMVSVFLTETNHDIRIKALEWFQKTTPDPEKVVPLLLEALGDSDKRIGFDCARTLVSYGHRASFALESLRRLSRTNDAYVARGASFALEAIDPGSALPIDVFRNHGQKPTKAFREIALLTEEGRLGQENDMEAAFARKAQAMGGDAIILHPMTFIGSGHGGEEDMRLLWTRKVIYKASVLVYVTGPTTTNRF